MCVSTGGNCSAAVDGATQDAAVAKQELSPRVSYMVIRVVIVMIVREHAVQECAAGRLLQLDEHRV